jgi:hypothetical protein
MRTVSSSSSSPRVKGWPLLVENYFNLEELDLFILAVVLEGRGFS